MYQGAATDSSAERHTAKTAVFPVFRVRHHDEVARIELAREEMARALDPEIGAAIVRELKAAGYRYVSLDLQGYRTGSLNEGLLLRPA